MRRCSSQVTVRPLLFPFNPVASACRAREVCGVYLGVYFSVMLAPAVRPREDCCPTGSENSTGTTHVQIARSFIHRPHDWPVCRRQARVHDGYKNQTANLHRNPSAANQRVSALCPLSSAGPGEGGRGSGGSSQDTRGGKHGQECRQETKEWDPKSFQKAQEHVSPRTSRK